MFVIHLELDLILSLSVYHPSFFSKILFVCRKLIVLFIFYQTEPHGFALTPACCQSHCTRPNQQIHLPPSPENEATYNERSGSGLSLVYLCRLLLFYFMIQHICDKRRSHLRVIQQFDIHYVSRVLLTLIN